MVHPFLSLISMFTAQCSVPVWFTVLKTLISAPAACLSPHLSGACKRVVNAETYH